MDGYGDLVCGGFAGVEWLDVLPSAARQAAADSRHVDARLELAGMSGEVVKRFADRVVTDGRAGAAAGRDAVLADHVGDPEVGGDLDELGCAELEVVGRAAAVPGA